MFKIVATLSAVIITGPALLSSVRAAGLDGTFGLAAMVHTKDWPNNPAVTPWDGKSDGEFTYSAIPCAGNAPMNNIGTNLPTYNGMIPGSRSPASTRSQPLKFSVKNGKMSGSIALVVCQLGPGPATDGRPDAERDRIMIEFTAEAEKRTGEETTFSGPFAIKGGTGRYANLRGEGTIRGYFMCFDPKGCAEGNKGMFRDMQYVMDGKFNDPAFSQ